MPRLLRQAFAIDITPSIQILVLAAEGQSLRRIAIGLSFITAIAWLEAAATQYYFSCQSLILAIDWLRLLMIITHYLLIHNIFTLIIAIDNIIAFLQLHISCHTIELPLITLPLPHIRRYGFSMLYLFVYWGCHCYSFIRYTRCWCFSHSRYATRPQLQ